MGTTADKLNKLLETKTAIKTAIVNKGVNVADTDSFASYADKINEISGGDEWQPNPNWCDIKKIVDEDTRDYKGKVGAILYNFSDVSEFNMTSTGVCAVATSDGAFYTYVDDGAKVTHNWDVTKDKDDGRGAKTRYAIYYFPSDSTVSRMEMYNTAYGWGNTGVAYIVLRINCSGQQLFEKQTHLEAVENEGYPVTGGSFQGFCNSCTRLQKPPRVDTTNTANFSTFCYQCNSLKKFPWALDTSKGVSFSNAFGSCYSLVELPNGFTVNGSANGVGRYGASLIKLPDGLDVSACTNLQYTFGSMNSLVDAGVFDMSGATNSFANATACPFYGAPWLTHIKLTLPSHNDFWLNASTRVTIESFRFIADNAPDVTATPHTLTIGSANITRCNEADPTIITDLQAKGWTVA
jgi:hypothetical protein